jgi:hypothetical protein
MSVFRQFTDYLTRLTANIALFTVPDSPFTDSNRQKIIAYAKEILSYNQLGLI